MLWDNGLYWLAIIILTILFAIFFGLYNRQADNERNDTFLVLGWVFLGIDLALFAYGLYGALFYTRPHTILTVL
jgi:hypothetical protein